MKYDELKLYSKKYSKDIKIGKWLFVVGILLVGLSFFMLAMFEKLYLAIACFAIFAISLETSIPFIESAESYKEHIRQTLVSIVFETMKGSCKNNGNYNIYWNHRDALVVYGHTDETEQSKIKKSLDDTLSRVKKEANLKFEWEVDLTSKEKANEV